MEAEEMRLQRRAGREGMELIWGQNGEGRTLVRHVLSNFNKRYRLYWQYVYFCTLVV
jgi:hypothetical protein